MFTLNCKGRLLQIDKPVVMGIINVTSDSFYEGSRLNDISDILATGERMITEGAQIIDIGGQSTRPGSQDIGKDEELKRVVVAVDALHRAFPEVIISIDTYRPAVAIAAVQAGASIVNDISSGNFDEGMLAAVADLHVPYVCMHLKGTPSTMQQEAVYEDLTKEVLDFFISAIHRCKLAGIRDVIIDPGFGFAKTIRHNFKLLKQLAVLQILDKPILSGLSRKSTIYKTLGIDAGLALNGTTVLNTMALLNGTSILRVHDVKQAMEAVKLYNAYQEA